MKRTHRQALADNGVSHEMLEKLDTEITNTIEQFITEHEIELNAKEETITNLQQIYYQHILMRCIELDKNIETYFMDILEDFDTKRTAQSSVFFVVGLCYASKEYTNPTVNQDLMKIIEHIKKQDIQVDHQSL